MMKLKAERRMVQRKYYAKRRQLQEEHKPPQEIIRLAGAREHELRTLDDEINAMASDNLWDNARAFDVEIPMDAEFWDRDDNRDRGFLNAKGRTAIRKLIDEEKTRRFEVKTRWVTKIILPLAGVLVGIIGALIGLVAALHKK